MIYKGPNIGYRVVKVEYKIYKSHRVYEAELPPGDWVSPNDRINVGMEGFGTIALQEIPELGSWLCLFLFSTFVSPARFNNIPSP